MRHPAALYVLVSVLIAGCSTEAAEPAPLPSVSATGGAVASASPTPEAVAVPPTAQAPTPEGASAFARFFYAELSRAFAEEDPEAVRRLSAPGCQACERYAASVAALKDDDESVTPVTYNIIAAEAPGFEKPPVRVDVIYDSPEIVRRDGQGNVLNTEPSVQGFQEELTLVAGPDGWLVQEVTAL